MALVAYDNSDSSDFDDDSTFTPLTETKVDVPSLEYINSEINKAPSLFNLLPQPVTHKASIYEEEDEFLHKKEEVTNIVKPKTKIMVPSLSDFKDVEKRTPHTKPKLSNGKKSGLLSILPQPKNAATSTKSLIPQVVLQKPKNDTAKKKNPLLLSQKNTKLTKTLGIDYSDESDNDDEVQNDFFSINKVVEAPVEELPLDLESKSNEIFDHTSQVKQPRSIETYFKQDEIKIIGNSNDTDHSRDVESNLHKKKINEVEHSNSNEVPLDDEAILKLCGTRGKRKREDIQIVDVNQQEVLADAREWLLKGLMDDTSKRASSSKRRGNEPTSQQKRKHQITYLAHQAKANEAELQNQWANNRVTKRKTQSKYGF